MDDLITFSTAYYDIGRTNWNYYGRSTDHYLKCFSKVSQIGGNLVIYCDPSDCDRIGEVVKDRANTIIIPCPFDQLEFYQKFYHRTKSIMESPDYHSSIIFHDIPEHKYPEYNIVNFNKVCFVEQSMKLRDTPYHGWIDFGYGHGRPNVNYTPTRDHILKCMSNDNIYMVALKTPKPESIFKRETYFLNDVCIQGSCFFGPKSHMQQFKTMVEGTIDHSLNMLCIDDDQTIYSMAYLMNPSMFTLKLDDWFTHFKET